MLRANAGISSHVGFSQAVIITYYGVSEPITWGYAAPRTESQGPGRNEEKMNMEGRSTYTVKRLFSFEAAHQLDNHPTCSVLHGHGYRGEISVISASLSRDGFVIDFGVLKSLISQYDHGPVLKKTAEELAEEIGTAALEQQIGRASCRERV